MRGRHTYMNFRMLTGLVLVACVSYAVGAAEPDKGRLLVATEVIQGDVFSQTVIVLLHYDDTGAAGLVVNRPTEVGITELFRDGDPMTGYEGTIYWGGPVEMGSLRAMLKTDEPPEGAENVIGSIYFVPLDETTKDILDEAGELRLFLGYAGWAPGQLDRELARGSWLVVPGTEERVFAKDTTGLWKKLAPRVEHRAAVDAL